MVQLAHQGLLESAVKKATTAIAASADIPVRRDLPDLLGLSDLWGLPDLWDLPGRPWICPSFRH